MLPYPVLLADIGGTFVRFAILAAPEARPNRVWKVPAVDFPGPVAALLQAYLGGQGRRGRLRLPCRRGPGGRGRHAPDQRALAVRRRRDRRPPLPGGRAAGQRLRAACGRAAHPRRSRPGTDRAGGRRIGPRLVVGPGTGLGAAALVPAGDRLLIQTTEAGHVCFGPCEPDDGLPWSALMRTGRRLTAEAVLFEPGLVRLARHRGGARDRGRL